MKANENNFIKRLQSNKEDALDYIVDSYLPLIKGVIAKVLLRTNHESLIDECVNDVFLSIWNHAGQFRGNNAQDFQKWICQIAKFKAIDYYRKAVRQPEITSDDLEHPSSNNVEDEMIRLENRSELLNFIKELDPTSQKIFVMRYFLGYNLNEIAEQLHMTTSSIRNRLYRGKKKLKKQSKHFEVGGMSYEGNL
ncbi:sigma-70 family RNA polymerase sigma factor [Salinibacillus xinjiangensis]|uniref:Sigma-70 family RNA polymerase sigma factor n=1 Tax=Salinibacillus xinjiangensis TaxID=1229268 RepID=A0A6G1X4R4_9BACI|nr:sigma-70 family RNA polymerase sigma factor [Salinibacillus xinjiangensis]MRG85937.1 sigma-70 family RNA polymerase sigma factor [Salinibacillus xinjiangensis]